jgi:thiol-disulfide isomerase/thioredoxin
MIRRFAMVVALGIAGLAPFASGAPMAAQETTPDCASALWLEPLAAAEEATPEIAEITEPAPALAWTTAELTDACSGETFALADFAGKTVYIESMATWCPPCLDQLVRVKEAAEQIPEDEQGDTVFVALSIEVDLPRETLAEYATANDLPFIFAVMPADMVQAMADDLGQEIAIPPATPHLIVAPDGTIGEIHTGGASAEDVLALLAEAGNDAGS